MISHKYSEIEKEICRTISGFVFNYKNQDAGEADRLISLFGITDVTYIPEDYSIHITLTRPGMLIGKRGETIEALSKWLKEKINPKVELFLHENRINEYFISWQTILGILNGEEY